MKKTKLKLKDAFELLAELEGFSNQEKVLIKGLLNEEIPLKRKYWIDRLTKKLQSHKKSFEGQRTKGIEKYGIKNKNGEFYIPFEVDVKGKKDKEGNPIKKRNPKFKQFQEEVDQALEVEIEIEHAEFFYSDIAEIKSNSNYSHFYDLLEEVKEDD